MNIGHKAYVFWVSYQYQWWVSSALEITVRQLGPASTVVCILCFFFSNLISLLGRVIMENNERKSICLPHQSWLLFVFSILYNIMRELPFTLFVIKILRVSLSFWPTFNKLNV